MEGQREARREAVDISLRGILRTEFDWCFLGPLVPLVNQSERL